MTDSIQTSLEDEEFLALLSIKYHKSRTRFFEGLSRWSNFVSLLASSAAVVSIVSPNSSEGLYLAGFVAAVQAATLVVQPSVLARRHAELAARHSEVERRVSRVATAEELKDLQRLRSEIEQDEPAEKWWLGLKMHNEILLYQRGRNASLYRIPLLQRGVLSQFWDISEKKAVRVATEAKPSNSSEFPAE
ncbi:hypothetical protein J7443_11545 [Tropicibacter sp. R15_0]|uniref:hypothetical protein n=1 Tax=Tropicibacter sp. R15_0 TaxID=2821101 RepID=UPI001ADB08D7|nr:hypothetical protein [Tropicibacter sp. R15_0]MBO9465866.1 hypothetical protein [Tropicibacter sp. R15_0]